MTRTTRLSAVLILVLIALHGVAAVLWLPQLEFHADLSVESDQDPRVAEAMAREQRFPSAAPIVVLTRETAERDTWVRRMNDAGLTVRSAQGDRAAQSSLESRLYLTPDQKNWVIYVTTKGDGQREAALVAELAKKQGAPSTSPSVGGAPWVRFLLDRALVNNVSWLVPGALLALWLAFMALTRRAGSALVLTGVSSLPALGLTLLFPAMGLSVNFTTLLAPLLTLALATTYTLHIDHHLREHGPGWKALLQHRGRAVFWSALISALGFSSLLLSPISSLQFLGFLLVVGLSLTLCWVLVAFPLLAECFPLHRRPSVLLPLGKSHEWSRWALAGAVLLSVAGLPATSTAMRWSDYLAPSSQEGRSLVAFETELPAWQEASLHLAWEEGGWLDGDRWNRLSALVSRWRQENPDLVLWSVQDAVEGIQGSQEMDRAEALEFLPPSTETGKLIDSARTELVVRFGVPSSRVGTSDGLDFLKWQNAASLALPGVQARWSGPLYRQAVGMESFLWGEFQGMAVFYLVTFVLITLKLRSFRRGFLAVMPALMTGAVFLGLAGWLGWPISPATALVAAACLGQSTDDGLLWSLLPHTAEVRSSLAESTLLLSAGLSVLLTSTFANVAQAGCLVIVSLCFSTFVVLWGLPWKKQQ